MIKKRIIGILIVRNNLLVQSIGFNKFLPIGQPSIAIEFLNNWGIDEIIIIDVSARIEGRCVNKADIYEYSKFCQVPLTVGGGISSISDVEQVIQSGADKIVMNSGGDFSESLMDDISRRFGNQCIVIAIDIIKIKNKYYIYNYMKKCATEIDPISLSQKAELFGAGELFVQFVNRDGMKIGYDCDYIDNLSNAINIPIIACSGASCKSDFLNLLRTNASAAAAGNYFNFSEHSVILLKRYLKQAGINVRLDTYADYESTLFDSSGKIKKNSDADLEKLRFDYVPEEVV